MREITATVGTVEHVGSISTGELQALADQAMLRLSTSTSPEVRQKAWEELTRLRLERDKKRALERASEAQ